MEVTEQEGGVGIKGQNQSQGIRTIQMATTLVTRACVGDKLCGAVRVHRMRTRRGGLKTVDRITVIILALSFAKHCHLGTQGTLE